MSVFASKKFARVDIEPTASGKKQWVDLRTELSAGLRDLAYGRLYKRKAIDSDELEIDIEAALSLVQTLEIWVVDWEVYDDDDKPVELTPAALASLSVDTSEVLMRRVNELRAERDARKKAGSTDPAS